MTFAVVGLVLMVISMVVMAMKPFKTTPTYSIMAAAAYLQLLAFLYATYVAINLSAFMHARSLGMLVIISFLAFCVPLLDAIRVFVLVLVRRRRGIQQLVVSCCGRRNPSNGYEELWWWW